MERLRDEAASSVLEPMPRAQEQMDVEDPAEEVRRLRAQVAELQHDRAAKQEVEENRAKKARILSMPPLDLTPIHSGVGGGARSASDVVLTLIDAADSALREVRST